MASTNLMDLPVEVRIMIWNYVLDIPRIITIDYDPDPDPGAFKRSQIHQTTPALLHVCRESRALTLPRYCSIFTPTKGKNEYTGSRELQTIERLLRLLNIEGLTTRKEKHDALSQYLAKNKKIPVLPKYAFQDPTGPALEVWFDQTQDTLLIDIPRGYSGPYSFRNRAYPLSTWDPWGPWMRLPIKRVAFNVHEIYDHSLVP